jgi:Phage protein U
MIGYFGTIIFETSSRKVLNFSGFKRDIKGRWEKHSVIGQKPVSEFIGPDLDAITFTVNLNGNNGVKPRDEMEHWNNYVTHGFAGVLVIGGKPVGDNLWNVQSVSEAWDTVFNQGELFGGKIDVTLEEYVEEIT